MGIVVSKKELDYNAINDAINKSSQPDFNSKLNEAVSANTIGNVTFSSGNNNSIYFKANTNSSNDIVSCIVEIDKQ